jgi:hypothetical protein
MSDRVRGFYQLSRAWYAAANITEDCTEVFNVGIFWVRPDDGTTGEFSIRRMRVGAKECWRLEVFDDAWAVLTEFTDLVAALAQLGDKASAEDIRKTLVGLGIEDLTPTERSPARCDYGATGTASLGEVKPDAE